MQMKKKKKLILLLTICFGMFLSVTGTVKAEDGVEVGNFRIDGGQLNADYRYASGVLTILSDQTLTIKNNYTHLESEDKLFSRFKNSMFFILSNDDSLLLKTLISLIAFLDSSSIT